MSHLPVDGFWEGSYKMGLVTLSHYDANTNHEEIYTKAFMAENSQSQGPISSSEALPRRMKVDGEPELAQFSQFRKLPTEIRIKIWGYAIREPRVVRLIVERDLEFPRAGTSRNNSANREARLHWTYGCQSPSSPRPTLLACKESRQETLKFSSSMLRISEKRSGVQFFPQLDIIFLDDVSILTLWAATLRCTENENLKHLSGFDDLGELAIAYMPQSWTYIKKMSHFLPNLMTLHFAVWEKTGPIFPRFEEFSDGIVKNFDEKLQKAQQQCATIVNAESMREDLKDDADAFSRYGRCTIGYPLTKDVIVLNEACKQMSRVALQWPHKSIKDHLGLSRGRM